MIDEIVFGLLLVAACAVGAALAVGVYAVAERAKRALARHYGVVDEEVCYDGLPVAVGFKELPDGTVVATAFETVYPSDESAPEIQR